MNKIKRGQKEIQKSKLEVFENKNRHRDYEITISSPEFTCLCPMTGYPDFGTITIKYVPEEFCLELKSVKLYINKFRDQGIFHEEVVNQILDDLVKVCKPRWLEVYGDFNPRGNVKTVVRVEYRAPGFEEKIA